MLQGRTPSQEIAAALAHIPAHDRDTWVCMAMAVKSELGEAGFDLWNDWSQSGDSYDPKAARVVWKSIKAGGRVTIASLFHEAFQAGWQPSKPYMPPTPEQRQQIEAERHAAQQLAEQEAERLRAAAKAKAAVLWTKAGAVRADHPYLIAKGIKPYGAKQLGGMLVLPLKVGGKLVNLQLIGLDGSKCFLVGGQVKGAALTLGSLKDATEVLLCEGWATGCSLHEATGQPVIVAWNAGNLVRTAERLAADLPEIALRVCGDADASDVGQQAARKAAEAHGMAVWCVPPFTLEQRQHSVAQGKDWPSDFNDLHQLAGLDAVRAALAHTTDEPANAVNPADSAGGVESAGDAGDTGGRADLLASRRSHFLGTLGDTGDKSRNTPFFVSEAMPGVRDGVYYSEPPREDGKEPPAPLWLCSPLHVVAETRDAEQSNWGRLLHWEDRDGYVHTWACPMEMLAAADTSEFRRELARRGLLINVNPKARQKLAEYVQTQRPLQKARLRCVAQIGWHDDRYVLPAAVYGNQVGEGVIYQGVSLGDFDQSGTLADWQQQVAAMAAGNSRTVLALSAAFAGALVGFALAPGGGLHFAGTTSKGKTSCILDPATSVWGHPERFAKKWRATVNGMEALCHARNDGVLILDELAQVSPAEAGSVAYLIANGSGKQRMTKDTGSRDAKLWQVMLLSAGEIDLAQHMAEAGKEPKGGQMARLPAIPADAGAGLGALETLHHFPDGAAFSKGMKAATRLSFGTAGTAFLGQLAEPVELAEVKASIHDGIAAIADTFRVPNDAALEVGRVADRFALIAYAGELATRYGITGWQPGEAVRAAQKCFAAWFAEAGAELGADDRALFARVASFLQLHGSSRFPPSDADPDELARYPNRAGFRDLRPDGAYEYWVCLEVFKNEICKGINHSAAAQRLIAAGLMRSGEVVNGKPRMTIKPRISALRQSLRVYALKAEALEGLQ
ncbi:DUF927 domain-containing protein [Chitinilyticum litopenaei]|uniref:DUF927 domain-containing protein n=1 Tax=Chitinilyticum litopenaei TaxID=1121276 RepID=UPI000413BC90|nr:DUF927 domain-containing protein [Chitinilyticum litopenaei]